MNSGLSAAAHCVSPDQKYCHADLAKGNLERLNPACSCQWHVTDMLSYMRHSKQHADIIIASFSMHHLTPEDKLAVLQEGHRCAGQQLKVRRALTCRQVLTLTLFRLLAASKGIFCMVDVLRGPAESVQGAQLQTNLEAGRPLLCRSQVDQQASQHPCTDGLLRVQTTVTGSAALQPGSGCWWTLLAARR